VVHSGKYSEHRRVSIRYGDGCRSLHCRAIRSASETCAGDISAGRAALSPNVSTPCVGSEGPLADSRHRSTRPGRAPISARHRLTFGESQ